MTPPPPPLPTATKSRRKGTLLVVDDEPEVREGLARLLRQAGHRVLTAADGREAFQLIATRGFDAILCDIRMPGLDGVTLFQRLRAMLGASTPFAYVTADASRVLGDILDHRSQKVFCKPFEMDAILGWIDEVLAAGAAHAGGSAGTPGPAAADGASASGAVSGGGTHLVDLAADDGAALHVARVEAVAFPELRVRVFEDRAFRVGAVFRVGAAREARVRVSEVARAAGVHVAGTRNAFLTMTLVALHDDAHARAAFDACAEGLATAVKAG